MQTLIINLLITLMSLNHSNIDISTQGGSDIQTVRLNQIDISKDTMIIKILNDWELYRPIGEGEASHSLIMSQYKNGRLIKIMTYKGTIADNDYNYNGYLDWKRNKILMSIIFPNYCGQPKPISIATEKKKASEIVDIHYYYIIDDIYAKYNQDQGWIWSDGKPDE